MQALKRKSELISVGTDRAQHGGHLTWVVNVDREDSEGELYHVLYGLVQDHLRLCHLVFCHCIHQVF